MTLPRAALALAWSGLLLAGFVFPAIAETIQLERRANTYLVEGRVNDAVTVRFVVDTGASDVALPEEAVDALMRAGKLDRSDVLGTRTYRIADGSTIAKKVINLRELSVGGHTVKNVTASVGRGLSPALLGQSFLSKFPSWTLDNERGVLVVATRGEAGEPRAGTGAGRSRYGAFAHDPGTGRYGASWNQESASRADVAALKGCASDKCKIVFRVKGGECGAIAATTDGKAWGGAKRPKREEAEKSALANCEKRPGAAGKCKVKTAECNK